MILFGASIRLPIWRQCNGMATTGFWPIKGSLKGAIDYAENPDKTTEQKYVDDDLFAALRYAGNDNKTDQKM